MSVVPKINSSSYADIAEQWQGRENAMSLRHSVAVWLSLSLVGWGGIVLGIRMLFS